MQGIPNGTNLVWTLRSDAGRTTTASAGFATKCTTPPPPPPPPPPAARARSASSSSASRTGTRPSRPRFGYQNENEGTVDIPVGPDNRFNPAPQGRGQTTVFAAGRVGARPSPSTSIPNGTNLVWIVSYAGSTRTTTASAIVHVEVQRAEPPHLHRIRRIRRIRPDPPDTAPTRHLRLRRPRAEPIGVFVQCVTNRGSTYDAVFGYQNDNEDRSSIAVGAGIGSFPRPQGRGQTTDFLPGNHPGGVHGHRHPGGQRARLGGHAAGDRRRSATVASNFPEKCSEPPRRHSRSASSRASSTAARGYDVVFGYESDNPVDVSIPIGLANRGPAPSPRIAVSPRSSARASTRTRSPSVAYGTTQLVSWYVSLPRHALRARVLVVGDQVLRDATRSCRSRSRPLCVGARARRTRRVQLREPDSKRRDHSRRSCERRSPRAPDEPGPARDLQAGRRAVRVRRPRRAVVENVTWTVSTAGRRSSPAPRCDLERDCIADGFTSARSISHREVGAAVVGQVGERVEYTIRGRERRRRRRRRASPCSIGSSTGASSCCRPRPSRGRCEVRGQGPATRASSASSGTSARERRRRSWSPRGPRAGHRQEPGHGPDASRPTSGRTTATTAGRAGPPQAARAPRARGRSLRSRAD